MELSNKIILASNSPRRKQLLSEAGFHFEVKTVPVDEVFPDELKKNQVAEYLATQKNHASRTAFGDEIIVTADTVVIFENEILGKPKTDIEAINVLKRLSGKTHQVITGVCISDPIKEVSFSSETEVKFKELTTEEINHYVQKFPSLDKAGSYGIQEWIGIIGVEWIKGSFYNVVGLPVDQVYHILKRTFNIEISNR